MAADDFEPAPSSSPSPRTTPSRDCELALVIGGDGSILRAAEITYADRTPVLGVNLGHVGFLAEAEPEEVDCRRSRRSSAAATPSRTGSPSTSASCRDGEVVTRTFAVNEASVEKAAARADARGDRRGRRPPAVALGLRRRRLRDADRLDRLQLQRRRPDRVAQVEALCLVPISAHALFARPMVIGPDSVIAIEVLARTDGAGVLWCDGRRTVELPPGRPDRGAPRRPSRSGSPGCTRRRSPTAWSPSSACPSRAGAARASDAGSASRRRPARRRAAPGSGEAPVIEEIRISSLGVIDCLRPRARARPDRDHRRDRRRQDDGRHRARPAPGRPRRQRRRPHRGQAGAGRGRRLASAT